MTKFKSDKSTCGLFICSDWTPLNQIFFSQCIQDSDEEESFICQQKRWKRKRYSSRNAKVCNKYRVYECASSSESEVSTSNEFRLADNFERTINSSVSDKQDISSSDKHNNLHYEERINIEDGESCPETEARLPDELDLVDDQKERVNIEDGKSCPETEARLADELDLVDNQKERINIEDGKSCPEPEAQLPDELDLVDDQKNNLYLKQSAVKCKKFLPNKNESSDESEIYSSTSSDAYDSSDSSYDYKKASKEKTKKIFTKSKSSQLSEYEKMIQKNREEKIKFLETLKFSEVKENFKEAIETLQNKSDKMKKKRKIFQNLENCLNGKGALKEISKVCRKSSRQKYLLEKKREMFTSFRSTNKLCSVLSFEEVIKKNHEYHDFISEVCGSEYKIPQLLNNDFVSHFESMTLQESQRMSSSLISTLAVHQSQKDIIVCFGNNIGEIIFWHVNSDYDLCAFQLHIQRVSCLKFNPYSPNVLISSSLDGTIYRGDFEKKMFSQVFKAENCKHFEFLSETSYLVAHGISYASIIDIRAHRKTLEKRHECKEDAVKTVSVHPVNKNYFISAHQKGAVRLWDLRKLQNNPVIEVCCKGENLISSSFSPVTGNSVLVTMSDTICLLDSSSLNKEFKLKKSIRHENNVKNVSLQATWLPNTDGTFVIGSRSNPRKIEIFDDKLYNTFNFTDDHFNYLPLFNVFHSSLPFLVSASQNRASIFF